jgi:hypothetical protein
MGLDQYLYRRHYVRNWDHEGNPWHIEISHDGKPVDPAELDVSKIVYVDEQIMQWRKANQIHAWFVRMVQEGTDDCGQYMVEEEQLAHLLDLCRQVLADRSLAPSLLPSQSGFFFGGTEYDDWYFKDLEETVAAIEPLIGKRGPGHDEYIYRSSW